MKYPIARTRYLVSRPINTMTFARSLKAENIGQLRDQRSFGDFARRQPSLIVNQEKIAQGLVNEVEPKITADLPQLAVVLD